MQKTIIYTHNLLNINNLFSKQELKEGKKIPNNIRQIKKKFYLPIDSYEIPVFIFNYGIPFLPPTIISYLENKDFIDGGAFIGDSALMFERKYNPQKIYAFEPDKENYNLMLKTIKKNNLVKVIPIQKALGEQNRELTLLSKQSTSYISKKGTQKIQVLKLDDFIIKNNINVGLIKLDVQGYALEVLKGAENVIKKFNPVLLIGNYHNGKEFFEVKNGGFPTKYKLSFIP